MSEAWLAPLPSQAAPVTLSDTLAPGTASQDHITSSAGDCFQVELWQTRCVAAFPLRSGGCPLPASCDVMSRPHSLCLALTLSGFPRRLPKPRLLGSFSSLQGATLTGLLHASCVQPALSADFQTFNPGPGLTPKSHMSTFSCTPAWTDLTLELLCVAQDQQRGHHLRACQKYSLSGHTPDPLSSPLRFNKTSRQFGCTFKCERLW